MIHDVSKKTFIEILIQNSMFRCIFGLGKLRLAKSEHHVIGVANLLALLGLVNCSLHCACSPVAPVREGARSQAGT